MEAIRNRLLKNYKHRKKWARKNNIEAYRLYERDLPDYPFIIDLYGQYAMVYFRGKESIDSQKPEHPEHIKSSLKEILDIDDSKIIFKNRKKQKGKDQYEILNRKKELIHINEHQAKFIINLYDYLDTGLFLDHRPIRQIIFNEANDKKFLNLFSYTGSVSVFAALAGAKTTSVDLSKTYQDWAIDNFELNNISLKNHSFITKSALDFVKDCNEKFDLIFLDPPTFSTSKKMESTFEVERDQIELVNNCMKLLKNDGKLYFSNNKRDFKLNENLKAKYKIKDIGSQTIPEDFRDKKIHVCFEIKKE